MRYTIQLTHWYLDEKHEQWVEIKTEVVFCKVFRREIRVKRQYDQSPLIFSRKNGALLNRSVIEKNGLKKTLSVHIESLEKYDIEKIRERT